jgi:hypothetical protein
LGGSGFIKIKHLAVFRDQAIQYLVEILKTPIGEVTADHRLAQSYDAKNGKIELPNKLGAMLSRMFVLPKLAKPSTDQPRACLLCPSNTSNSLDDSRYS